MSKEGHTANLFAGGADLSAEDIARDASKCSAAATGRVRNGSHNVDFPALLLKFPH